MKFFALSGLAGGVAEIVWLQAYNLHGGAGLKDIGSEVATTLHVSTGNPYMGLIIHLLLSVLIGIAFGKIIYEKFCNKNLILLMLCSVAILASIWVGTFKIILPIINPAMANIVPSNISFISKLLFAAGMALMYLARDLLRVVAPIRVESTAKDAQ